MCSINQQRVSYVVRKTDDWDLFSFLTENFFAILIDKTKGIVKCFTIINQQKVVLLIFEYCVSSHLSHPVARGVKWATLVGYRLIVFYPRPKDNRPCV